MDTIIGLARIFFDPVGLVSGVIVGFITLLVVRKVYKV